MHVFTLESIFVMSSGAKNYKVFTYFRLNLCNVLDAENDTVMHLLLSESIFVMAKGAKNDNVFTYFGVNICNV